MSEEVRQPVLVILLLVLSGSIMISVVLYIHLLRYRKQVKSLTGDVRARKMMDEFERKLGSGKTKFSKSFPVPKVERKDDYQLWIYPEKQDPTTDVVVPKILVQYFWENDQYELRLYLKKYLRNGNSTGFQLRGSEQISSQLSEGSKIVESAVNIAVELYEEEYRSPAKYT